MKFAVRLKDATNVLEDVADSFQGDSARIIKLGDGWFLESSAFDACTTEIEVVRIAQTILPSIHRVCVLYVQLYSNFEIGGVDIFSDTGVLINRTLRDSTQITVYSAEGLQELQNPHGEESLGSAVVGAAMENESVHEALAMLGDLQWPQLYNILEFLGGVDAIVKKTWATRGPVIKCRQTANHYRHLGSPKKYPLPPNPPSLSQARSLVLDVLKKWISMQL
jgi:hypothetical protein